MSGNQSLEEIEKNCRVFHFAVLRHLLPKPSNRNSHWDLLLESPNSKTDSLWTFEVQNPPHIWRTESITQLADHRKVYLTYEGPISNGRGKVSNVLNGTVTWDLVSDDRLELLLVGTGKFSDWRKCCHLTRTSQHGDLDHGPRWEMSISELE